VTVSFSAACRLLVDFFYDSIFSPILKLPSASNLDSSFNNILYFLNADSFSENDKHGEVCVNWTVAMASLCRGRSLVVALVVHSKV